MPPKTQKKAGTGKTVKRPRTPVRRHSDDEWTGNQSKRITRNEKRKATSLDQELERAETSKQLPVAEPVQEIVAEQAMELSIRSHNSTINISNLTIASHYTTAEESLDSRKNLRVQFCEEVEEREISDYSSMSCLSEPSVFDCFSSDDSGVRTTSSDSNHSEENGNESDSSSSSIEFLGIMPSTRVLPFPSHYAEEVKPEQLNETAINNEQDTSSFYSPITSPTVVPVQKKRVTWHQEVVEINYIPEEWFDNMDETDIRNLVKQELFDEEDTDDHSIEHRADDSTLDESIGIIEHRDSVTEVGIIDKIPRSLNPVPKDEGNKENESGNQETVQVEPPRIQSPRSPSIAEEPIQPIESELEKLRRDLDNQRLAQDFYKTVMEQRFKVEKILRENAQETVTRLEASLDAEIKNRLVFEDENDRLHTRLVTLEVENVKLKKQLERLRKKPVITLDESTEIQETGPSFSALLNSSRLPMRSPLPMLSESMDGESDGYRRLSEPMSTTSEMDDSLSINLPSTSSTC